MLTSRKSFYAILLLGLVIRLSLCIRYPQDLTTDSDAYLAHARIVANGEGFAGPSTHRPTAFRPPAYPVVLGLQMKLGCSDSLSVATTNIVSSVVILESKPPRVFDRAVSQALQRWKFNPGADGRSYEAEINFKL